ncbi:MAG: hypothetical protein ETSY1_14885 [Candidatus Entotheonella factor]|uniref:DUF433 domain-containing protein n=1 Tax=Entotheonella factor TaxID=1429438 RepID=W4LNC8_ENTF1|nr:DUF433 domain-containing protein [Candidatus Entotheonella palauensis]ETW99477.1 MAG: hypothetical protein ETSY1_14885 [Candidatus Entotheonella factor]
MSKAEPYVQCDEQGVMRVSHTRVMLDSIVAGFEQGHSPETIQQQYPALSLEEVYGAITYYLAHREEVEAYLKRQDEQWESWRLTSQANASSVLERLRALRKVDAPKTT